MKVLGVDPGATTGLSLIVNGEVTEEMEVQSLLSIWDFFHIWKPEVLVVESLDSTPFVYMASPYKAIGVCELYAEREGIEIVYSNPAFLQGKKKPRGLSPHIWSARVHALAYKE